jgi:hypothetical protein
MRYILSGHRREDGTTIAGVPKGRRQLTDNQKIGGLRMHSFKSLVRLSAALVVLLFMGCRGPVPIYNVEAAPVSANKPVTAEDVQKAIVRAGTTLGWQMVPRDPGVVEGTLLLRKHRAVVDVSYDTKSYNIKYKDSAELDYDSQGQKIHPNYNGWIQNLDKAIRVNLNNL